MFMEIIAYVGSSSEMYGHALHAHTRGVRDAAPYEYMKIGANMVYSVSEHMGMSYMFLNMMLYLQNTICDAKQSF